MKEVPSRNQVAVEDQWDLSPLFEDAEAWEKAFLRWEKKIPQYASFRGTFSRGADALAACLRFHFAFSRQGERLGTYASLKVAEDAGNADSQKRYGRFMNVASRAGQEASFMAPEVLSLSMKTLRGYLDDRKMAPYRLWLERLMEEKPHTLGEKEEKLLAMQAEMERTADNVFDQLTDVDMKFGSVKDHEGNVVELSHATYASLLFGPRRAVRKNAFLRYYQTFDDHKNTLAAVYAGGVQRDVYQAKARKFGSSLEAVLFGERIPSQVYDQLIASVRAALPELHAYYQIRQKMMKLSDLHMYDVYVPMFQDAKVNFPWDEAVRMVLEATRPLGEDYVATLERGLKQERWCDRYENRGKASGAFSCGSYDGMPYILMNYQSDVRDSVFTLAHEAGHSMHSYYSAKHQPFPYYNYELFVAEVASTFNEQLLHHYLLEQCKTKRERQSLANRQIDAIRSTIFRQTMFAEFERDVHAAAEAGEALTLELFRSIYARLLRDYFGPDFALDEVLSLECLRIPHFYHAFYVYKYATGLSAAIALSRRVLSGGDRERKDYRKFLSGGGSQTPLELLKMAGVDMRSPEPVEQAMQMFRELVRSLE
ncbi:MAG: oligoendopeptidase F [Planctomycetia bacterium]|nr:oligoendopeptidase F [Planctomycetia bacterium]